MLLTRLNKVICSNTSLSVAIGHDSRRHHHNSIPKLKQAECDILSEALEMLQIAVKSIDSKRLLVLSRSCKENFRIIV